MSRTQSRDIAPPNLPGYRFIRHLGAGGNAQVYLYEQDLPQREVAVKVLNESALAEAARRRFTAEANVTAGLAHRHIVQVFDAKVTDDGRPYIVMPYYPQPNLSVRARRAHFPVAEVLRIGIQIGSAVETRHRHGVLHRDIKPQNILTDSYGEPGLTDFGIATTTGGDGPEGLSVPWSPPEILFGAEAATSARTSTRSAPRSGTCSSAGRRSTNGAATTRPRADGQDQVLSGAAHRPRRRPRQPSSDCCPGHGEGSGRRPQTAMELSPACSRSSRSCGCRSRSPSCLPTGRRHRIRAVTRSPGAPGAPATRRPAPHMTGGPSFPGVVPRRPGTPGDQAPGMRTRGPGRVPSRTTPRAPARRGASTRGASPKKNRRRAPAGRCGSIRGAARGSGNGRAPAPAPVPAGRPGSRDAGTTPVRAGLLRRIRRGWIRSARKPIVRNESWLGPDATHRFRNRGGPEPRDRQDRPGARPRG